MSRDSSTSLGMTDREFLIPVLLSMKIFAVRHRTNSPWRACANFCALCFVPQSRDFWSAHCLPACVRASSRRFWGRRPLIEKRCEDASHSQSTSCKMPCRISTGVHVRSSKDRMVHLRLPIRQTILIDWPGAIDKRRSVSRLQLFSLSGSRSMNQLGRCSLVAASSRVFSQPALPWEWPARSTPVSAWAKIG